MIPNFLLRYLVTELKEKNARPRFPLPVPALGRTTPYHPRCASEVFPNSFHKGCEQIGDQPWIGYSYNQLANEIYRNPLFSN